MDLTKYIRNIPNFPKPGILFKDITPLLADPDAFHAAIHAMMQHYERTSIDAISAADPEIGEQVCQELTRVALSLEKKRPARRRSVLFEQPEKQGGFSHPGLGEKCHKASPSFDAIHECGQRFAMTRRRV